MSAATSKPVNAWLALAPLLIGTFTGTVNNQVVNVPMDAILGGLRVPLSNGVFVIVAFNLSFAVLMPLSGWVGDRLGGRRIFCWAMAGIALGAVGAALAPNLITLVTCRVIQGVATAAVLPGVMSMIASLFGTERRGRALGLWAAVNGAGQAVGPTMGGLFADWFGWRSIFWPSVPLAVLAVVMTLWLVPRDLPKATRLEWRGAVLLTASATFCLIAATLIPPLGVGSLVVWGTLALGIVATVAYVLVERGRSDAFLPPGLLLEPRYLRSALAVSAQMFCLGATLLGVPLNLVQEHGMSTSAAGLMILALPVAMTLLAPASGIATERLSPRIAMRCGLGLLVLAEATLALHLGSHRTPDTALVGCSLPSASGWPSYRRRPRPVPPGRGPANGCRSGVVQLGPVRRLRAGCVLGGCRGGRGLRRDVRGVRRRRAAGHADVLPVGRLGVAADETSAPASAPVISPGLGPGQPAQSSAQSAGSGRQSELVLEVVLDLAERLDAAGQPDHELCLGLLDIHPQRAGDPVELVEHRVPVQVQPPRGGVDVSRLLDVSQHDPLEIAGVRPSACRSGRSILGEGTARSTLGDV